MFSQATHSPPIVSYIPILFLNRRVTLNDHRLSYPVKPFPFLKALLVLSQNYLDHLVPLEHQLLSIRFNYLGFLESLAHIPLAN